MIKILHSADWHLGAPLQCRDDAQSRLLRENLEKIPQKLARLCRERGCQMMVLSGDVTDGVGDPETARHLREVFAELKIPVFIAPGNHDYICADSLWLRQAWPDNVHIFTGNEITCVTLPELDCAVYGGAFTQMDCPGLLENFRAESDCRYTVGVFHGDPTQVSSPYNPVTAAQVRASGLDYLALGHIHKGGSFRADKTLCAWPGCPMGRGFDEQGKKGALIVTLDETAQAEFVPLDAPAFYEFSLDASDDPAQALASVLPPVGNTDFYRITFTGESQPLELETLLLPGFPNLELRDETVLPADLWGSAGEDTFEGLYFRRLHSAMEAADPDTARRIRLAAEISRKLLSGREVELP